MVGRLLIQAESAAAGGGAPESRASLGCLGAAQGPAFPASSQAMPPPVRVLCFGVCGIRGFTARPAPRPACVSCSGAGSHGFAHGSQGLAQTGCLCGSWAVPAPPPPPRLLVSLFVIAKGRIRAFLIFVLATQKFVE